MILSLFRIVRHSYHPHTAVLVNDEKVGDATTIPVLVITAMLIAVPSSANQGHAIRSRAGWSGGLRPISATQLEVWERQSRSIPINIASASPRLP